MSAERAGSVPAVGGVAQPLTHSGAIIAFHRSPGLTVGGSPNLVQVDGQLPRTALWQGTSRSGPRVAVPPGGERYFVGGRGRGASSVHVRDPDGDLLELMICPDLSKEEIDVS